MLHVKAFFSGVGAHLRVPLRFASRFSILHQTPLPSTLSLYCAVRVETHTHIHAHMPHSLIERLQVLHRAQQNGDRAPPQAHRKILGVTCTVERIHPKCTLAHLHPFSREGSKRSSRLAHTKAQTKAPHRFPSRKQSKSTVPLCRPTPSLALEWSA